MYKSINFRILRLLDSNKESYFETDSFKLSIDTLAKQVEYAKNEIVIVANCILNPYLNHSK